MYFTREVGCYDIRKYKCLVNRMECKDAFREKRVQVRAMVARLSSQDDTHKTRVGTKVVLSTKRNIIIDMVTMFDYILTKPRQMFFILVRKLA